MKNNYVDSSFVLWRFTILKKKLCKENKFYIFLKTDWVISSSFFSCYAKETNLSDFNSNNFQNRL